MESMAEASAPLNYNAEQNVRVSYTQIDIILDCRSNGVIHTLTYKFFLSCMRGAPVSVSCFVNEHNY